MANIYLGPIGSEVLLPRLRKIGRMDAEIQIEHNKQIDKATMLDGSTRYNFREYHPRRWQFAWEALTAAELADFLTIDGHNGVLHFQNNWESADWHWVVISDFRHPINVRVSCAGNTRYDVSLTLDEVL